jgi:hypothetical protein
MKTYDPNQTLKHVPYRQVKAEFKRQEQRFVRFWTTTFWLLMMGMLILFIVERLVPLAP